MTFRDKQVLFSWTDLELLHLFVIHNVPMPDEDTAIAHLDDVPF